VTGIESLHRMALAADAVRREQNAALRADSFVEHRAEHIAFATRRAVEVLGEEAAAGLVWVYDELTPGDVEGVDAWLNDWTRLRFQYDANDEKAWFGLVRQCRECGHERRDAVHVLADLADLLAEVSADGEA
jgi:hypothetical protein